MEKSLLVSQCARQLDPSSTTDPDQPLILGLNPKQVMEFMPSEKVNLQKRNKEHLIYYSQMRKANENLTNFVNKFD